MKRIDDFMRTMKQCDEMARDIMFDNPEKISYVKLESNREHAIHLLMVSDTAWKVWRFVTYAKCGMCDESSEAYRAAVDTLEMLRLYERIHHIAESHIPNVQGKRIIQNW